MTDGISDAFEDLSHALRVLLEANIKAHHGRLLQVDRAEAVGNIDNGYASVLNAFHSIYDAVVKNPDQDSLNWYHHPELAVILALRNARHHNHSKKIRSLYSYHAQESADMGKMSMYVLVDFPAQEEDADTFELYLSWGDLDRLLLMPKSVSKIREEVGDGIRQYIGSSNFRDYAQHFQLNEEQVFFNVVPLIVNAAAILVPAISRFITPASTESETFLSLFSSMLPANTKQHEVNCGPIALIP